MFFFISVSLFLEVLLVLILSLFFSNGTVWFAGCNNLISSYFIFDSLSFYLVLLVLLLGLYSQIFFINFLSSTTRIFLFLSLLFTSLCFCINHSILFWCFYELSMLPLLYLIFKESPYSERFLAGWYFSAYLLVTSLPLVLTLLYLSFVNNSFFFNEWGGSNLSIAVFILLSFIFFTKVPLVPFHTWLPIVHAEATSIVSIFLSGYIMKLGLLGVYRCSYFVFDQSFIYYLFICCVFAVFFFITSCGELDGKRWLAFLSLAHIVVPFFAFYVSDWATINCSFFYCLGHGLSAGLVFGALWYFYDLCNSRNWLLLKSSINGKSSMFLIIFSLLSLCSFPPTVQFLCEVSIISVSVNNFIYIIFWSLYLFFGGLVPLILCGHILVRSEYSENFDCSSYNYFYYLVCLCLWCYLGVIVL